MFEWHHEDCGICNSSGKRQEFDDKKNRWVRVDKPCMVCKGNGHRYYRLELSNPADFFERKIYKTQ